MNIGVWILLFFLGAVMGSFAGVIIERGRGGFEWKRWIEILGGRSYCPGCGHTLTWWQLLPLVGWLLQRGRCFHCKLPIPVWYNRIEIAMGVAFILTVGFITSWSVGSVLVDLTLLHEIIFWLGVTWAFVAIIVADLFWYELNVYMWLFLVLWLLGWGITQTILPFEQMAMRAGIWLAIFGLIWWLSRRYVRQKLHLEGEGIGEGDIMIAVVVGLLFPAITGTDYRISAVQLSCMYLIISSTLGIVFWVVRLWLFGSSDRMLPFLPAMIVAFWLLLWQAPGVLGIINI